MTLRNRVTPFGDLVADPARGTLTGNRGVLHDEHGAIVRRHQTTRWIACALEFRGRRREPMPPGRWTMLFFRDEPTALAAGHRPCAQCRWGDHTRFLDAWARAHGSSSRPRVAEVDRLLHAQRSVAPAERPRGRPTVLPAGTFVLFEDAAWRVDHEALLRWTPAGDDAARALPREPLPVLTPQGIVAVLESGYLSG